MSLYFLSDVHITGDADPRAHEFAGFLSSLGAGDVLVIGGDLFDLFVGNKRAFLRQYSAALDAIRALAERGGMIFYLEGNHDFHLRQVFDGLAGFTLVHEEVSFDFGGKKIFAAHGDQIDREDHGYLFLRFVTRTYLFRMLLWALPDWFVARVGEWSSRQSRKYHDLSGENGSDDRVQRTRGLFLDYAKDKIARGAEVVLLGHSHVQDRVSLASGGRSGEYVNVGFAQKGLRYAVLAHGAASMEIKEYPAR